MYIEFNNVSEELQDLIKLHEGDTKKVEAKTSQVNNEYNKRRNELINKRKVTKDVDRVVVQFNSVVKEVRDWSDQTAKELAKKGPVTKKVKDAAKEITEIDVSLNLICFLLVYNQTLITEDARQSCYYI